MATRENEFDLARWQQDLFHEVAGMVGHALGNPLARAVPYAVLGPFHPRKLLGYIAERQDGTVGELLNLLAPEPPPEPPPYDFRDRSPTAREAWRQYNEAFVDWYITSGPIGELTLAATVGDNAALRTIKPLKEAVDRLRKKLVGWWDSSKGAFNERVKNVPEVAQAVREVEEEATKAFGKDFRLGVLKEPPFIGAFERYPVGETRLYDLMEMTRPSGGLYDLPYTEDLARMAQGIEPDILKTIRMHAKKPMELYGTLGLYAPTLSQLGLWPQRTRHVAQELKDIPRDYFRATLGHELQHATSFQRMVRQHGREKALEELARMSAPGIDPHFDRIMRDLFGAIAEDPALPSYVRHYAKEWSEQPVTSQPFLQGFADYLGLLPSQDRKTVIDSLLKRDDLFLPNFHIELAREFPGEFPPKGIFYSYGSPQEYASALAEMLFAPPAGGIPARYKEPLETLAEIMEQETGFRPTLPMFH